MSECGVCIGGLDIDGTVDFESICQRSRWGMAPEGREKRMVGKVYIKWAGGYDPALGKSVKDPTLSAKRARAGRKAAAIRRAKRKEQRAVRER